MNTLYLGLAVLLLLTISAGLVRMLCAATAAERSQACRLLGTSGVAMVLLLAEAFTASGLREMVVLLSLLGGVTAVAFILLTWWTLSESSYHRPAPGRRRFLPADLYQGPAE